MTSSGPDLDTLAGNAISALQHLQTHLQEGRQSRNTMAGVARKDWSGHYHDEFEAGLKTIYTQSISDEGEIGALITTIQRELAASKQTPAPAS